MNTVKNVIMMEHVFHVQIINIQGLIAKKLVQDVQEELVILMEFV